MGEDDHGRGKRGKISTYMNNNLVKVEDCDENGYIVAKESEIILKDKLSFKNGDKRPFSGVIATFHGNGSFDSKKYYKDGVFTGKTEFFNPDGTLKNVVNEKDSNNQGNSPSTIKSPEAEGK